MAASARQIEANRCNAAGPHHMTEAGKQSIRANALRHGLTAQTHVVLPGEDQHFYQQILESLQTEYAPVNAQEEMLVQQIAQSYWRLMRVRNMETGSFQFNMNAPQSDPVSRGGNLAMVLCENDAVFSKLSRYEASIERSYYRAIRELERKQAARPHPPAAVPPPEIRSVSQKALTPPTEPEQFRSVSSNPPELTQQPPQTHAAPDDAAHQTQSWT